MKNTLLRYLSDESGAVAIEYSIIGTFSVIAAAVIYHFAGDVRETLVEAIMNSHRRGISE